MQTHSADIISFATGKVIEQGEAIEPRQGIVRPQGGVYIVPRGMSLQEALEIVLGGLESGEL